jgi:hypothetical protein
MVHSLKLCCLSVKSNKPSSSLSLRSRIGVMSSVPCSESEGVVQKHSVPLPTLVISNSNWYSSSAFTPTFPSSTWRRSNATISATWISVLLVAIVSVSPSSEKLTEAVDGIQRPASVPAGVSFSAVSADALLTPRSAAAIQQVMASATRMCSPCGEEYYASMVYTLEY